MIFSSLTFLFYYLPVFLILYRITPTRWQNAVLFLASLFFYAWGEPRYVLVMLFSAAADYVYGLRIGRWLSLPAKGPENSSFANRCRRHARKYLCLSLLTNLSLLIFFKYSNLLLETAALAAPFQFTPLNITLPVGISFYTFQTMSYSIDVYRGEVAPQKNFLDFAAYVTLFPQLIAGPIVRYQTVERELRRRTTAPEEGIPLFITGLAQKVLLANNIGLVWEELCQRDLRTISAAAAWLGILAYAFQIYYDFCGYSNMAVGLGRMIGFHFPRNFSLPYSSRSISEFWRRWHITLGAWFREYVYIPLGGSRRGLALQLRNILIVWLLTGIWHGASWNFLFWGLYFALLLIAEKLWTGKLLERLPSLIRHIYAMFFILIGWVFFAFDQPSRILLYLSALFGINRGRPADSAVLFYLFNNLPLFMICIASSSAVCLDQLRKIAAFFRERFPRLTPVLKTAVWLVLLLLCTAYITGSSYNPFLYFRF